MLLTHSRQKGICVDNFNWENWHTKTIKINDKEKDDAVILLKMSEIESHSMLKGRQSKVFFL